MSKKVDFNSLQQAVNKAKRDNTDHKTPKQKKDKGIVKKVEKKVNFFLREDYFNDLKILAVKRNTSMKELITEAIKEMYFKK